MPTLLQLKHSGVCGSGWVWCTCVCVLGGGKGTELAEILTFFKLDTLAKEHCKRKCSYINVVGNLGQVRVPSYCLF